ncbi:MAG TPA: hypothetical protein VGL29_06685 [Blastocatellia bacterium]
MYLLAGIVGLTAGFIVWLTASHWIASSITRFEERHPELTGSKRLRAYEAVACGALFAGCLALAFLITRLLWTEMK